MTIKENARFTVYRLVDEYNPQNGNLWDIAKMIKNAFHINAIQEWEVERFCYILRITFDEVMTA